MGKGTIVSHIANGQYSVTVNYYREQYAATMAKLAENIASLTSNISKLQVGTEEYNVAKLQLTALQKEKSTLENSFPEDKTLTAWCADLTTDLSGVVSTVEINGESETVQISPGYEGKAAYKATSGQLSPTVSQGAAQTFYNLAMLPGWQKWKPTFRYGIISDIDKGNDTCTVTLENAVSSQQSINVNQSSVLINVPIEYMSCNSAAFKNGDDILVKFENQDWNQPKVIGFKEEPAPCDQQLLYVELNAYSTSRDIKYAYDYIVIWDVNGNDYARDVTDNNGDLVENWPVLKSSISLFLSDFTQIGEDAILQSEAFAVTDFPYIGIDYELTSSICTETWPGSTECRRKTEIYELVSAELGQEDIDDGYSLGVMDATTYSYYACWNTANCDLTQRVDEIEHNFQRKISVQSLTNNPESFDLISSVKRVGDYFFNDYFPYLDKEIYEGQRLTTRDVNISLLGNQEIVYSITEQRIYQPGFTEEGVMLPGYDNQDTTTDEDAFQFFSSVVGNEDIPYIVLAGYKPCPRFIKVVPPCTPADEIIGSGYYCRRADTNEWEHSDTNNPSWAATEDEVTYSGDDPTLIMYVLQANGDPMNESPFDAEYKGKFSEAMTAAFKVMMTGMDRFTPVDNFIFQEMSLKFLTYS